MTLNRREWMAGVAGAAVCGSLRGAPVPQRELPDPSVAKLPRWRGFNLLSYFMVHNKEAFPEEDFQAVAEFGFDFVRLPLDYRCWTDKDDWTKIREVDLEPIDRAIEYGRKHGVHVQVNFHRAPGFTVASPPEAKPVWSDSEALEVCCQHWAHFARRYRGIPSRFVDFNPFNEPTNKVSAEDHRRVIERVVAAIRKEDPERLIVCDGRSWATEPPVELAGLGVAASMHGYEPSPVTHWKASWMEGADRWPEPTWPLEQGGRKVDRSSLQARVDRWKALERDHGMGVHVGEFGCHNRTPHPVVLAWMRDGLEIWKNAGWGWALWNLRGSFGVLDSGRRDVAYADWRGHKLDRAMLDLLQKSG